MVLKKENNLIHLHRVPTGTGKPGKTVRHFPVREKSGNFEQSGKNQGTVGGKSHKILENSGNFRKIFICYFS